jgi:hypothetical protein
MVTNGFSPRLRKFILVVARLAVLVYAFQMSSIDHHADPNSITGIKDSAVHAAHCHSAQASCADASGLTSSLNEINLAPAAPAAHLAGDLGFLYQPIEASIRAPSEPPRAA